MLKLHSVYDRETGTVQDRKRRAPERPPNLDLFDDLQPPAPVLAKQQAADNFDILYRRVATETFWVDVERVTNAEEAAQLMAPLCKRAEEYFYAWVLDKDGKILDLQLHSKGTRDGASVHPEVVIPAIVSVSSPGHGLGQQRSGSKSYRQGVPEKPRAV